MNSYDKSSTWQKKKDIYDKNRLDGDSQVQLLTNKFAKNLQQRDTSITQLSFSEWVNKDKKAAYREYRQ